MNSLHILHSEAATGWGGQEIRVFQESRLLLERGHRVTVVCRPGTPLAERCAGLQNPNFHFHAVDMPSSLSLSAFLTLRGLIREARPDILHTHSSIDSWLVSFCGKCLGIPVVRSRHVSIPVKNYFPKNWIYSFPAKIIASGGAIAEIMSRLDGVGPENVVSVEAGVDLRRFDCSISGARIRDELKVSPGQPLIGKIAVIRGWKGHDYFLKAIPAIRARFPAARFVIVGDGPGFAEIKQKAAQAGLGDALAMLGHREDVPEIMAALDVLVQASTAGEGTPQVLAQAFAMKVPVVGTRTGSIPEVLGEGSRGELVIPADADSLASGVIRLLENPDHARALAESAYAHCLAGLTIDQMIDKTIAVYRSVL